MSGTGSGDEGGNEQLGRQFADKLSLVMDLSGTAAPARRGGDVGSDDEDEATGPSGQANAAPGTITVAGQVFRQGNESDIGRLLNAIVGTGRVPVSSINAFEAYLKPIWQRGLAVDSFKELVDAVEDEPDEEEDYNYGDAIDEETGRVTLTTGMWELEGEDFRANDLTEEYQPGESVRAQQSMDYKTTDKDAFEIVGDDDHVLLVRMHFPPDTASLEQEADTLARLEKMGVPAIEVIDRGYVKLNGEVLPAMVMPRMAGSSKSLVRWSGKDVRRTKGWEDQLVALFPTRNKCKRAIDSLSQIGAKLAGRGVNDIQFLIGPDGAFVVNDAAEIDKKFVQANTEVINDLVRMITDHQDGLPRR